MELSRHSKRVLQLYIFLEQTSFGKHSGLGENVKWKYYTELTASLRQNFLTLASAHSDKFHKTMHSALNKLLFNYVSHTEV